MIINPMGMVRGNSHSLAGEISSRREVPGRVQGSGLGCLAVAGHIPLMHCSSFNVLFHYPCIHSIYRIIPARRCLFLGSRT